MADDAEEIARREEEYIQRLTAQKQKKFASNVFGGGLAAARDAQEHGTTVRKPVSSTPSSPITAKPAPQQAPKPTSPRTHYQTPVNRAPPEIVNRSPDVVYEKPQQHTSPVGNSGCSCGFSNPPAAKFCCGCGGPLASVAGGIQHSCGAFNPPGCKFCSGCGSIIPPSASTSLGPIQVPQHTIEETNLVSPRQAFEIDPEELERREEERMLKKVGNTKR